MSAFLNNMHHIAIDGLPGLGKGKLAKAISNYLEMNVLEENTEENPYIIYRLAKLKNINFQAQTYFTINRYQQLLELKQWDLFSHGIVADFSFERNLLYAQAMLAENEYYIFEKMYNVLRKDISPPDAIIYLQTSPDFVLSSIENRNLEFEKRIIRKHIPLLNQMYNSFYFNQCLSPVLVINCARTNLDSLSELEGILYALKNMKRGVVRYIPQQLQNEDLLL